MSYPCVLKSKICGDKGESEGVHYVLGTITVTIFFEEGSESDGDGDDGYVSPKVIQSS